MNEKKLVYLDFLKPNYQDKIKFLQKDNALETVDECDTLKYCKTLKCNYVTIFCEKYPHKLKMLHNPPLILYYIGDFRLMNEDIIAVTGTRENSYYGCESTKFIVNTLEGILISSFSRGIDRIAHNTAQKSIAVLPAGFNSMYSSNRNLLKKIEENGLLITEYAPHILPKSNNFLMSNRIIAGLCDKLYVVEASTKSKSMLITNIALDLNKEIYALPGNVFSKKSEGTNRLIEDGANLLFPKQILK